MLESFQRLSTFMFQPAQVENSPSAPPVQTPTVSDKMSPPVLSSPVQSRRSPWLYKSSSLRQTRHDRAMAFLWILLLPRLRTAPPTVRKLFHVRLTAEGVKHCLG